MTPSTTNANSITGPQPSRFGVLETNIVVRLVVYYLVVAIVAIVAWRYLPPSLRDLLHSATQPLVGLTNTQFTTFTTPGPALDMLSPLAVTFM